jgi:hypothetical protein
MNDHNPFMTWTWVTLAVGIFISWSVIILLWGSWLGLLGMLGWLPWTVFIVLNVRWLRAHRPQKAGAR